MTNEEFYGEHYKTLLRIKRDIQNILEDLKEDYPEHFLYVLSRFKTADSTIEKLQRKHISYNNLYTDIYDIIGFRIVCPFISDIHFCIQKIKQIPNIQIVIEKDYITHPKESGYQSYHILGKYKGYNFEIQIRTIAFDFWAALEHKIHYKKNIQNEELISSELKRVAGNIKALDIDMQTLKEMIDEN